MNLEQIPSDQNKGVALFNLIRQWFLSFEIWLSTLIGVALGLYTSVFSSLQKSNFPNQIELDWTSVTFVAIVLCILFCWASWLTTKTFLDRQVLSKKTRILLLLSSECLLILPLLGTFGYAFMTSVSFGQELTVLGNIKLPWNRTFTHLPIQGYLLLLWAGPWLVLNWFIKFVLFARTLVEKISSFNKKKMMFILFGSSLAFYAGCGLWTTTVYPPTGDEPHYLLMSQSVIADFDIDLENQMKNKTYQKFYPVENLDFHTTPTASGKLISKHFPLLSIIIIPFYILAGRFGASLFIMCMASGIAVVLYKLSQQLQFTDKQALYVWVFSTIAVPLGIYFDLIYTELPAVLVFLLAVYYWVKNKETSGLIAAIVASLLPWLYPKYALLSIVLVSLLFISGKNQLKAIVVPSVGILLSAISYYLFFTHYYSFGIAENPYGTFKNPFSIERVKNILGLMVDRDFGMIATLPALLLSVTGFYLLKPEQKAFSWVALVVFALQFILYSIFEDFTGSAAVFSRHMLPGVFLLFPMIILGWERLYQQGRIKKYIVNGLMLLSIVFAWLCSSLPFLRYLAPKIKLYSKLGFSPSLFPSLADGASGYELVWAALLLLFIVIIMKKYLLATRKAEYAEI